MQKSGQGREVRAHSPLISFAASCILLIFTGPFAVYTVTEAASLVIPTSVCAIAVPVPITNAIVKASVFMALPSRFSCSLGVSIVPE